MIRRKVGVRGGRYTMDGSGGKKIVELRRAERLGGGVEGRLIGAEQDQAYIAGVLRGAVEVAGV